MKLALTPLAAAFLFTAASAHAATVQIAPGDLVSIEAGDVYTATEDVGAGTGDRARRHKFSDTYKIEANVSAASLIASTATGTDGRSALRKLTMVFKDAEDGSVIARLRLTDRKGFVLGNVLEDLKLRLGQTYKLRVSGVVGKQSGQYSFDLTAPTDITAAVPVPPALLLFGSALAGLGFLRRRKA